MKRFVKLLLLATLCVAVLGIGDIVYSVLRWGDTGPLYVKLVSSQPIDDAVASIGVVESRSPWQLKVPSNKGLFSISLRSGQDSFSATVKTFRDTASCWIGDVMPEGPASWVVWRKDVDPPGYDPEVGTHGDYDGLRVCLPEDGTFLFTYPSTEDEVQCDGVVVESIVPEKLLGHEAVLRVRCGHVAFTGKSWSVTLEPSRPIAIHMECFRAESNRIASSRISIATRQSEVPQVVSATDPKEGLTATVNAQLRTETLPVGVVLGPRIRVDLALRE